MKARRDTRSGALRAGSNPIDEDALPPAAVREILLLLPADQRARAACVCRCWRDAAAEPALWTVLDLSEASGVTVRVTRERLLAAAAKAQGRLEVLYVPDVVRLLPAVHGVAAANATLRVLKCVERLDGEADQIGDDVLALEALLLAAPALQVLEASAKCDYATARRLLRNQPPFGPLRLLRLEVDLRFADRDVAVLAADMASHESLKGVLLECDENLPLTLGELDSVVTAALALPLNSLAMNECGLTPAAVPALCRLLKSASLTQLHFWQLGLPVSLLDEHVAAQLAAALRANRTLNDLMLTGVLESALDQALILLALVGHASLRELEWSCNYSRDAFGVEARYQEIVGSAFGALVAANAPALEKLDVQFSRLGDSGLGPLADALPHNTHLCDLIISDNRASHAFGTQRLLPAVRANDSLRVLQADDGADEAMRLIEERSAAAEDGRG